jgi:2-amino-4-hydroxy-6-hydroxymethyldihydropteridine diphosphokinase
MAASEARMSTLALVGLGSNLGDRKTTLESAIRLLGESARVTVRSVSSFHETAAAGGPAGQGSFLNAAAALDTTLAPVSLLRRLREIEEGLGRVRTVRWGERTIDLDLLLFGDAIIDTHELSVPHLRMSVRRFVLAPLAEIAPTSVDPLTRRTVAELLANLDRRPGVVALARSACDSRLIHELGRALDADRWVLTDSSVDARVPELWPTFLVVAGEEADESLNAWAERNHLGDHFPFDVPILRVRSKVGKEPDEVVWRERIMAEVLAACASAEG